MGLLIPIAIVMCSILAAFAPTWVPVPYPASGLVSDIPLHQLPKDLTTWEEMCPPASLSQQKLLNNAQRLFDGIMQGSESVAVAPDGVLYMADKHGNVWRARPNSTSDYALDDAPLQYTGPGRTLGLALDDRGNLLLCDVPKGLVEVDLESYRIRLLGNGVYSPGSAPPFSPIFYADDLDIAADGTVYFSDATNIVPIKKRGSTDWDMWTPFALTMFKGEASGRLLAYHPSNGSVSVVKQGIWFPNGVALSADESFVVVAETLGRRLHKVWLTGDKKFQSEILLDGIPAFPDNVARASDGNFWVALVGPSKPFLKYVTGRLARLVLSWLPMLHPDPLGAIIKVTPEGRVVECLLDMNGVHVSGVTDVKEHNGRLFTGHLSQNYITVIDLQTSARST